MRSPFLTSFIAISAVALQIGNAFAQTGLDPSCSQRIKSIAETMATLNDRHVDPTLTTLEQLTPATFQVSVVDQSTTRMATFQVTIYEDCRIESVTDLN
ncbi:MAG: hypothetical protein NDJ89_00030 [Oligoflexia bacterium]|nr:hypothetical protein [Oligoflexia bacterium]